MGSACIPNPIYKCWSFMMDWTNLALMRARSPRIHFGVVVLRKRHGPACDINHAHHSRSCFGKKEFPMILLIICIYCILYLTIFFHRFPEEPGPFGCGHCHQIHRWGATGKKTISALMVAGGWSLRWMLIFVKPSQPVNLETFLFGKADGCGKRGARRMPYAPSWCFWPGMDVCELWVRGPRASFFLWRMGRAKENTWGGWLGRWPRESLLLMTRFSTNFPAQSEGVMHSWGSSLEIRQRYGGGHELRATLKRPSMQVHRL